MVALMPLRRARDVVSRWVGGRVTVTSVGLARTARPARYGRQLVSHLGRKVETRWDDAANRGEVVFDANARAVLTTTDDGLVVTLTCPMSRREELRDVLVRHLERFGAKDGLHLTWEA